MTNKQPDSNPDLEQLRRVTNKLNNITVDIPHMIFTYRSYYAMPDFILPQEAKDNLAKIIETVAWLFRRNLVFLLKGPYERYLAYLMEIDYPQLVDPTLNTYDTMFKVVKYTKLSYKLYEKDILYVYDDDYIMVVIEPKLAKKFRILRGNA